MKATLVPIVPVLLFAFNFIPEGDESWLLPDKFFYEAGEEAKISVQTGADFIGESTGWGKDRINTITHVTGTTRSDVTMHYREGEAYPLQIALAQDGTHVVALETKAAQVTKQAGPFNQYVRNYGLDNVYYHRETSNTLQAAAQIEQTTFHKLLFQVGQPADDVAAKPLGFPIEIIPHKNPYALKQGDPVAFTILSAGKPLFGARVRIWNRFNNRTTIQQIYTEQDGTIRTHISNPGSWMVTAVSMEPAPGKAETWRSFQTSLVFGVK